MDPYCRFPLAEKKEDNFNLQLLTNSNLQGSYESNLYPISKEHTKATCTLSPRNIRKQPVHNLQGTYMKATYTQFADETM
ncbi:hypothetical protein J6590_071094, partial [Homalodisca vitripennis]